MYCHNHERRQQQKMYNTEVHRPDIGVRLTEYLQITFNMLNNF